MTRDGCRGYSSWDVGMRGRRDDEGQRRCRRSWALLRAQGLLLRMERYILEDEK